MTDMLLRQADIGISSASIAQPAATNAKVRQRHEFAGMTLELIVDLAGFQSLEADWNELYSAAARPEQVFQSYNWCWHWMRHYIGDGRTGPSLSIVTGRRDGRLVLLMPFVIQLRAGLRELSWLGEPVSQYGDIVADSTATGPNDLVTAWRWAVKATRADVANLRRVRADAVAAPMLSALGASIVATEEAPFLTLAHETNFAGWEERRQPRGRKNRRRQSRRLAEMGPVTFEEHTGTATAAKLAAEAIRMKRAALDAKAAIALSLADDRFEAFFTDAAAGLGRPAGVKVLALKSNDSPAALKILVENRTTSFLHVAVFDPRFEKCATGALLLEHVVEKNIREQRKTLDLLPPRHEYKLDFADGSALVHDHALALTLKGRAYAWGYLGMRRRLKSAIVAMPAPVRRAVAKLAGR